MTLFSSSRNWILNAVPAIGTHSAVNFIREKFFADELTYAEAIQALMASVHLVTADLQTIRLFEASLPCCFFYSYFTFKHDMQWVLSHFCRAY